MEHDVAVKLIEKGIVQNSTPQIWLDLGCGQGTFTYALSDLLFPGSHIIAVDVANQSLNLNYKEGIEIQFIRHDFTLALPINEQPEGILIANALHFVKDQSAFLKEIISLHLNLKNLIIIEYDTNVSNQWVPFPIRFKDLKSIFNNLQVGQITKTGEHMSIFSKTIIYSAQIRF